LSARVIDQDNYERVPVMKIGFALAILASSVLIAGNPASAAGCLKGAAVGGAAGHYAHHHGVLGAIAGCIIGRHEAAKHRREQDLQARQPNGNTY
jgi:outer membrane lipoprotein SlyB